MNLNRTDPELAQFETARAALANATRAVALENVARILEVLPPAGIRGWTAAWTAGLVFAQATAQRWIGTANAAYTCEFDGAELERLNEIGTRLARVVSEALTLIERLAQVPEA